MSGLADELDRRLRAYVASERGSSAECQQALAIADLIGRNEKTILTALARRPQADEEMVERAIDAISVLAYQTDRNRDRDWLRAIVHAVLGVGKTCTCHPDDRPEGPCPKRYAASECQAAAALRRPQATEERPSDERAAIVAYIRECELNDGSQRILHQLADAIERGDHLPPEDDAK